jgi:hypothetical protein
MQLETIDTPVNAPFQEWRRNVHSQYGEDGIIEELMKRAGLSHGYFIEFGAWDGRHLSNCALLAERDWPGCFIEGDAQRHTDLLANYADRPNISAVHALVGTSGENALGAILHRVGAPDTPAVLSIDIDGNDYHVWAALEGFRPSLCVVEFNPTIPSNVIYVQEEAQDVHRGCSLTALWRLAHSKGYALVAATDLNGFFMPMSLCADKRIPTYHPQEIKDRRYEAYLFHGYDGTMLVGGRRELLWHGVPYAPLDLQLLPQSLRSFQVNCNDEFYRELGSFREKLTIEPRP